MANPNNPQNVTATGAESTKTKKKWSLNKKLLVIFGTIIGVIAALVLIANAATSAAVKVSNQLVSSIQAKDSVTAYSLLSQEAKNVTDAQDFSEMVNQIGPILSGKPNMKSKEVSAQTGSASTAKVVYEIDGNDGLVYVFTVNLVKEGEDWKVLNFDSVKKAGSSSNNSETSANINKEVQSKCMTAVNDETFCKFAGAFANVTDYNTVMNSVEGGETTTANIAIASNGDSSMAIMQNGVTTATIVTYGGATYVQDPSDMSWVKYSAGNTEMPSVMDIKKDFLASDFKNDDGTMDQYFNKGTETVDGIKCYKFQMVDSSKPDEQSFMWFDTQSFLLRKLTNTDSTTELTLTFSYEDVTVSQPSPVNATY